jgi:SAM-dependent methyltransferase
MDDPWELGEAYEMFMGRWSRPVAREFLRWLHLPRNGRWLDVGCGTGALSETVVQMAAPQSVTGIDFSDGFVRHARQLHPQPPYDFRVGNAMDLPVKSNAYDAVISGIALNFFPEPATAVSEMNRAAKPGGTIAAYLWDYAADMQMLRTFWDAAIVLDADAATLDEGLRFPICQPQLLQKLFADAGLQAVIAAPLETTAVFRDFDDYWHPFLGKNGPAPGYIASRTAEQLAALADHLRQTLPIQSDQTIPLKIRAWAVRGTKP